MDVLAMDEDFLELSSGDMREMWDTSTLLETSLAEGDGEWSHYEDRSASVILRDRMITEASLPIKSEHSYCNEVSELCHMPHVKLEDDMESECYPAISMSTATSGGGELLTRDDVTHRTVSSSSSDGDSGIGLSTTTSGTTITTNGTTITTNGTNTTNSGTNTTNNGTSSSDISDSVDVTRPNLTPSAVTTAVTAVNSANIVSHISNASSVSHISGVCSIGPVPAAQRSVTQPVTQRSVVTQPVTQRPVSAAQPVTQRPVSVAQPVTQSRRVVLTPQSREELLLRADRGVQPAHIKISAGQSVLRPQTIVLTSRTPGLVQRPADSGAVPRLSVKLEPNTAFVLPPTPPSSVDSDGGASPPYGGPARLSPVRSLLQRPPKVLVTTGRPPVRHVSSALISTTPRGAHGSLYLTEEEKRTLVSEGYSIPSRLPLTKQEERSLKKIRRKIKNKISAQESRRKKKEYMDQMERRLDQMAADTEDYRLRLDALEAQRDALSAANAQLERRNTQLAGQLEQLRSLLGPDCPPLKDEAPKAEDPN